jgi:hypothetical protein
MALAEISQGVENNPTAALKTFLAEVLTLAVAPFGEDQQMDPLSSSPNSLKFSWQ